MICSVCQKKIEPHRGADGKVYWDQGHNAQPVNDGRCCNSCNEYIVLPARIQQMLNYDFKEELENAK